VVPRPISRRAFLAGTGAAVALTALGCSGGGGSGTGDEAAAAGPPTSSLPPPPAPPGPATFVFRGPTDAPNVALTFHTDGDLSIARALLDELAARDVRMTSFVVGEWLEANPDWAAVLTDGGHELANHTYSHVTFSELDPSAMAAEIDRCRDVLVGLTGSGGAFFRPSGTADGTTTPAPAVLATAGASGYPTVLGFDVDPFDYDDPGATAVADRTLEAVGPGSVVSLHFGHPGTVTALPVILDGLEARGLRPVPASELLAVA
jgi:peptidoglycan/xylan/chitin deacetylase (PgdA/CDA1 family)